ncbi:MAG: YdcF family protein [Clostridia bacterium]|nr:YdcF family protein [Clostridia bacterium]
MIMHSAIAVMLALFIAVEGIICTAAFQKPPMNLDYIIVLGAKVNGTSPSGALRNRIQLASEYLHENPRTLVIASGGQGPDEGISEAECIRRGLIQRGISEDRIIMEDASTSTLENILFSLPLIPDHSAGIGIVTNNYHMYRALKIANAQADRAFYPVPVATSLLSLPHAMVREFAALVVGFLSGDFS